MTHGPPSQKDGTTRYTNEARIRRKGGSRSRMQYDVQTGVSGPVAEALPGGWVDTTSEAGWLDDVTSGKSGAHGWLHPVHGSQVCGSHGLGQTEASQGPHQSAHATNIMVGCSGQDGKQCSHPIVMHLFGFVHGDTSMRVNTLQSRAPLPSLPEDLVALLPCSLSC